MILTLNPVPSPKKDLIFRRSYWLFIYVISWLSGGLVSSSVAQPLSFEHLSSEQGLSQNSVVTIAQDSRGFMWFGTPMGLNRYDGRQFRTYRAIPTDSTSLSGNFVASLLADRHQNLWVGTRDGLCRYNPATDAFEQIPLPVKQPGKPTHMSVNCLYEDRSGAIWIGTQNGLYRLQNPASRQFQAYFIQLDADRSGAENTRNNIRAVLEDAAGNLWVGTANGLIRMRIRSGQYAVQVFRHESANPGTLSDNYVTTLAEDRQHQLWIGTLNGGLNKYVAVSQTFSCFLYRPENPTGLVHNEVRKILFDRRGQLWIGTQQGLSLFDPVRQIFTNYKHSPADAKSLIRNSIHYIFEDRQGSVWLGIYYGGINVSHSSHTDFTAYQNRADRPGLNDDVVSSIVETKPGTIWIGTEGGGITIFQPAEKRFSAYKNHPNDPTSLGSNLVKVVYQDRRGQIWAGTHGGGLNLFDPTRHSFRRFLFDPADAHLVNDEVIALLESRQGTFWVGTSYGLLAFRNTQPPLIPLPTSPIQRRIGAVTVRSLLEDRHGNRWIGTTAGLFTDGAARLNQLVGQSKLSSTSINCLREDAAGRIWIGTNANGLGLFDPKTYTLRTFTIADGLPGNDITEVLNDETGSLWIGTANGLSRLNFRFHRFINYTTSDGLAGNSFNYNAACKTQAGELLFGGYQGMTGFYPQHIGVSHTPTPLVFTNLRLFNQPVRPNASDNLLKKDISLTKALVFQHDQHVFSLDFALLSFVKSGKNQYAYQLTGFDKDWVHSPIPSATYTNLPSGQYTLRIKGADHDGVWSRPVALSIVVLPPFWQTGWAYLLYALLVAGSIVFVIRFFVLRALLRRDKELNQLKLNFFTNISHEIRTHLTLIAGPIERLMLARRDDALVHQQLGHVQKDAGRLLKLVTELMDFRKAETNHLNLSVAQYDLVSFLNDIYLFFQEVVQSKQITITFSHEADTLPAWFDRTQLEKVLFNLLSNAYKFTSDGGQIELRLTHQSNSVVIQVIDNGRGIAPEHLNNLFTNYFQVADHGMQNTGYGIGLALSKAIVELHSGSLTVESQVNAEAGQNCTCFTVTLQPGRDHLAKYIPSPTASDPESISQLERPDPANRLTTLAAIVPIEAVAQPAIVPHTFALSTNKSYSILLVEDNPAVRAFVSEALSDRYQLIEQPNGKAGWEAATELIPDLIISDVTMPEMDGFTLCNRLKSDERTNHIPVILLTAQSTTLSRVNGLSLGADCYLTKPFSLQILELYIRNLLTARETMQARFGRQLTLQPQNITISPVDEPFLAKLRQILEQHIDNTEFDVDLLATEVGMSRSVLYKKVKALTDMSVGDFIKSYRLQKAALYLQQKTMTINEVAYSVGFSDRKYFSKEFKKQFGQSPSEHTGYEKVGEQ